ncbi:MAG: hypothetical protein LBC18_01450, partial [Opitutaceae bacterium]|nr:hypothetical protein [Opitutaceae bacterium]
MHLKPLLITVAALALLSGITWFATRPPAPPAAAGDRAGEPVAPAAQIAPATRVAITENGKTGELVRGDAQAGRVAP